MLLFEWNIYSDFGVEKMRTKIHQRHVPTSQMNNVRNMREKKWEKTIAQKTIETLRSEWISVRNLNEKSFVCVNLNKNKYFNLIEKKTQFDYGFLLLLPWTRRSLTLIFFVFVPLQHQTSESIFRRRALVLSVSGVLPVIFAVDPHHS